jgi:hypothetical protein
MKQVDIVVRRVLRLELSIDPVGERDREADDDLDDDDDMADDEGWDEEDEEDDEDDEDLDDDWDDEDDVPRVPRRGGGRPPTRAPLWDDNEWDPGAPKETEEVKRQRRRERRPEEDPWADE